MGTPEIQFKKINKSNASCGLIDSSLNIDRVFNGNYWDDFVLPVFLRKNIENVLLLGVGYGAGIRSILAANPNIKITGIDIDRESNRQCQEIFSTNFSHQPKLITADASDYLKTSQEKFDLIWVDLYSTSGPVENLFALSFWQQLKMHLNKGGVAATNIYGIANHLEPFLTETPAKSIQSLVGLEFKEILAVPHRRNMTLIASNAAFEKVTAQSNFSIDTFDQLTLKMQALRAHKAIATPVEFSELIEASQFSFQDLNNLQQQSWGYYLYELNQTLAHITGIQFISPRSLVTYLQDPNTGPFLIDTLRTLKSDLIIMIPTFLGADIHNHDLEIKWYFDYLETNASAMKSENEIFWHKYFLPQWISMLNSRVGLRTGSHQKVIEALYE